MKVLYLFIISCAIASAGNAQGEIGILENYLNALPLTMHGESSSEDIERLTRLYADDIIYEHPRFGMKIESKDSVKTGLKAFLDSYAGNETNTKLSMFNQIVGTNVAIVEFEIRFLTKESNEIKRKQVQVIEFEKDKITRIIDYW